MRRYQVAVAKQVRRAFPSLVLIESVNLLLQAGFAVVGLLVGAPWPVMVAPLAIGLLTAGLLLTNLEQLGSTTATLDAEERAVAWEEEEPSR